MPDARITIEGRVASDPRFGTTQAGKPVGNLRILAGRSRKDEQGNWQTLSTTAYEAAFWEAHHDLMAGLGAQKGDSVIVSGTVSGVESYQGQNGESLTVKVNADGLRVFPKQQQGGYSQPQQGYGQQAPQQGYAAPQGDPWAGGQAAPQGGYQDGPPPF